MRNPSVAAKRLSVAALLTIAILPSGCETFMQNYDSYGSQVQRFGQGYVPSAAADAPSAGLPGGGGVTSGELGGNVVASSGQFAIGADRDNGTSQAVENLPPHRQRQMVYSARFVVSTPNVEQAMTRFILAVENWGGYLESREDSHVVCRIPAERFDELVATMPTLGSIVSQSIRNEDVTRRYQDLNLRIETAEWSRRRVLSLLERAEKIEDILKLEKELLKLTATIEGLKGTLTYLSEQIAYSKVEVFFRSIMLESKSGRPAADSPFAWINRIGVEHMSQGFGSVETSDKLNVSPSALLPGGLSVGPLEGFLVVKKDRDELKAITPDASKLWVRDLKVPRRGSLDFWSKALENNLVDQRGYRPVGKRPVRDRENHKGVEMVFDVVMQGATHRYLVSIYVFDGSFWQPGSRVRVVEFVAPETTFDNHIAGVQQSTTKR